MLHGNFNTNLIIYQPGYGGNLLLRLFSLDPVTFSIATANNPNVERFDLYSFNHSKKFSHWQHFHFNHCDSGIISPISNSIRFDNQVLVLVTHPAEHEKGELVEWISTLNPIRYLATLLRSEFSDYWLMRTQEKWGGFPSLRKQEIVQEELIRNTYNPVTISIDSILNLHTWQDEYLRINKLMNLTPNLAVATTIYQEWYDLRVAPLKEEFNTLSVDQIRMYSERRDKTEDDSRN